MTRINTVLIGKAVLFGPKGELSAFKKTSTDKCVDVTTVGLRGDEQADLKNHGGIDKAILHYAYDHYSVWKNEKPELNDQLQLPGAFGENISTHGLTENDVCIGDRFSLGSAEVEVSQGRQPCWKLGHRFADKHMVRAVVETGRCGWYYRVVTSGKVRVNDPIKLLSRPNPYWTVAKVFGLLIGGRSDINEIIKLSELEHLSEHWRIRAQKLYTTSLNK